MEHNIIMAWSDSKVFLDISRAALKKCELFVAENYIRLQLAKT